MKDSDGRIWATCPRCNWRAEADTHEQAFHQSRDHYDDVHVPQDKKESR